MIALYCIVRGTVPPTLSGGLPQAEPPRALPLPDGLTAVVASLPASCYPPDQLDARLRDVAWVSEAALGHEQLLERLMASVSAMLPMKLLTLFSSDERLRADLAARRDALAAAAARVEGCEEYGLRIFAAAKPNDADATARLRPGSGTAFLQRKQDARERGRAEADRRAHYVRDTHARLADAASKAVVRPPAPDAAERPLVEAAYLVRRDARSTFGSAVEQARSQASQAGATIHLTGPWPPYHFVEDGDGA